MKRIKTKQLPIGFTDKHRKMIDEILKKDGGATYLTISSVVQGAVVHLYNTLIVKGKDIEVGKEEEVKNENDK